MRPILSLGTSHLVYGATPRPHVEAKDPRRALACLLERGMDAGVAAEIAYRGDLTPETGVAHAQRVRKNGVTLLVSDGRTRGEKVAMRQRR